MFGSSNDHDEEADELRSLSTMDTLTFRRLRAGRQARSKPKGSDDESTGGSRKSTSSGTSMRRSNIRGNRNDDNASMGDTLTTMTNMSSWSRRANHNYDTGSTSSSRRGRSRGEGGAGAGRRCFIDICLLFVLGVVLIIKFGSVELDSYSKLRGADQYSTPTEGNSYAEWLMRQSVVSEIEDRDGDMVSAKNHDAAEAFFDQAIDNLKNGVPQSYDSYAKAASDHDVNLDNEDWKRKQLEQPFIRQSQLESPQQQQFGDIGQNEQSIGGIKSQYESAQPLSGAHSLSDTQQVPQQQEFQGFQEALAQQQLQQAIVQQQQQQPLLDLTQQNNENPQQPNQSGQMSLVDFAKSQQNDKAFLLDPANQIESQIQPAMQSGQSLESSGIVAPESNIPIPGQNVVAPDSNIPKAVADGLQTMAASGRKLQIATWNIAAINNNPFEYWITYDENPEYEKIMIAIEEFLESPAEKDVEVSAVFTEDMFSQLEKRMDGVGWPNVRSYWEGDFKNRKIVSGFMKDPLLGSKRLASMPDRITNTINVVGSDEPVCRPTVINMFEGDLSTLELWWAAWEKFMFDTPLAIQNNGETVTDPVYKLLQPIKKAKYPDITSEEEQVSLPLQTMCAAIFDAILVHMMNTVSQPEVWQALKKTMVENLNKQKIPHTLDILENVYGTSDVITLQEVSASFITQAKSRALGEKFWIVAPADLDAVRDQNSVIFLSRQTFPLGPTAEITSLVEGSFEAGVDVPIAKGDILAITATDRDNISFVIASFHGDTNGLATKPVLSAIMKAMITNTTLATSKLIFGLDANTYENAKPGKQQDVLEWGQHYVSLGLTSCWGDAPNPSNYTTFNSRTYLQPQLNKACKKSDKRSNGDVNPKDFILFGKGDFKVSSMWKDNTGEKKYVEEMAFPTLKFPSDHGILATIIEPVASNQVLSQNEMSIG